MILRQLYLFSICVSDSTLRAAIGHGGGLHDRRICFSLLVLEK